MANSAASSNALFQPALPPALRESALGRLSFVMRLIAAALLISEALHWIQVYFGNEVPFEANSRARLLAVIPTLMCWRVLESKQSNPAFRLGFARVWLWCVTLLMGYMEWMAEPQFGSMAMVGISRVCLVVCLAPILIPDSLKSNFTYSGALFLTYPLGYLLARLSGLHEMATAELFSTFSSNLIAVAAAWLAAATVNQLREQLAGQFGSYRLVRKMSAGGYGEVWEAAHRHLRRPAAIKLIKAELGDQVTQERFLREAATLSSLECAHTVRLFDYGVSESGTLYLAMELLHGLNLEELVARYGPQPEARIAPLLAQACLSLEEAHEQGLIHRDVKPANLFVSRVGLEPDFLKVLDFGLVKTANDGQNHLTQAEQVIGTPDCMSPEQVSGRSLDGRSDLYSLGCVGYLLLTGTPVFPSDTAVKTIMNHLTKTPDSPSERLGRTVEPGLEALILSLLSKEPDARPASARVLYDQLLLLPHWSRTESMAWWGEQFGAESLSVSREAWLVPA